VGGGSLPYTGPGDLLAALFLAMMAATGGSLLFLHASSREAVMSMGRRTMRSLSGFSIAHNDLDREDEAKRDDE
jgi:hypothetical protein